MKIKQIIASFVIAGLAIANAYAADMTDSQKKEVETIVHDYLIKNPDVVVQSLQVYQQNQMDQARKTMEKTQSNAPKFVDVLFHKAGDPVGGSANGKITVVEFFDYQCPHCVDMTPVIDDLVKNNPDVRIVFKEFPIRGPISVFASRAALAANMQGKYFEFHKGLMEVKQQPLTQDSILAVAKNVGLDVDKLKADMNSETVNQQLKATNKLAQDLQLLGTPAFFIAKSSVTNSSPASAIIFIPGEMNKEQMDEVLKKANQS